jgi:nucleoside-diphosphate-sugar epimerase
VRVLITGGAGFLGKALAARLLQRGHLSAGGRDESIDGITLVDVVPAEGLNDARISQVTGDISDRRLLERAAEGRPSSIFHLAAVVSGQAEADFDLGMRVNLDGTRCLLETLRATGRRPRLVFASGFAVFGGEMPEVLGDTFHPTPQSSYGTQKAIGELLVADYGRRGFVDGRTLRLPTIVVRPGKPNKAASTFASSIIREPLAGQEAVCPVARDTALYILSPRRVIEALLRAMRLPEATWGSNRTLSLPGITVTIGEMVDALARVAGEAVTRRISWEPDPLVQRIVASWPSRAEGARARAMGFAADRSFDEIVRSHIEDELGGRVTA